MYSILILFFILAAITAGYLFMRGARTKTVEAVPSFKWHQTEPGPILLVKEGEEDFRDLNLAGISPRSVNGWFEIVASGKHEGKHVSFVIRILPSKLPPEKLDMGIVLYKADVVFESIGVKSDDFVSVLSHIYGVSPKTRMAKQISMVGITLEGRPEDVFDHNVKFKLFHESDDEDEYFEAYLNFEPLRGILELNEKDPEYRQAIVSILGNQ